MRQAGLYRWLNLLSILEKFGFTLCKVDKSLYVFQSDETVIAICINIDNDIITSNSLATIENFKGALCSNFEIKWSDTLKWIVGLECTFGEGEVAIEQNRIKNNILEAYSRRVVQHNLPLPPLLSMTLSVQEAMVVATHLRLVVGPLAYLVSGSRPDLAFAVNYLARHSMAPTVDHWEFLYYVSGYLLQTHRCGIALKPGIFSLNLRSDARWGGNLELSQLGLIL
ncbi:hypothetical protein O181_003411 [Austropuccinia psidii MF-1]|uniref:Reverse transcriptase Ty1/copia-type domain-containing protein n=1 Tax=Austropuccinia psidii MF-1 TaxID=1389203 RepID=A0A9Q3BDR1_9BASI|nr:hypothetical protein [Austropuccinia psidii MF-1]